MGILEEFLKNIGELKPQSKQSDGRKKPIIYLCS